MPPPIDIPFPPPAEVLKHFGARLVAPLGGRMNLHWLVQQGTVNAVLRRWCPTTDDIGYELRLLVEIAKLGWPVAPALEESFYDGAHTWTLFPHLPGEPRLDRYSPDEQRARGRLLAEFHLSVAQLPDLGQRGTWRRGEAILADECWTPPSPRPRRNVPRTSKSAVGTWPGHENAPPE